MKVNEGCQVELISFGKSSSSKLIEIADDFIDLCQEPEKYLIGHKIYDNRKKVGKIKNVA